MALRPYTRTFANTAANLLRYTGSSVRQVHRPGGNIGSGFGGRTTPSGPAVAPEATSAIDRAIAQYQPGGGFGKGTEAALARGETRAVASGAQSLVSAGLAGTTMMAGLGKKYQEEVAAPMRARVEETRAQAISGLEMTKAQIIQGATESARASALQKYLAQLQSDTAITAGAARQPVSQPAQQPMQITSGRGTQPAYKFPSAPSLISGSGITGRSPTASYYGSAEFQR